MIEFEGGVDSKIDSQVSSYLDRNGIWKAKEQIVENLTQFSQANTRLKYRKSIAYSLFTNYTTMFGEKVRNGSQYVGLDEKLFTCNKSGLVFFDTYAGDYSDPVTNSSYARLVYNTTGSMSNSPPTWKSSLNFFVYHIENGEEVIDSTCALTGHNGYYYGSAVTTAPSTTPNGYGAWCIYNQPLMQTLIFFVKNGVDYFYKIVYIHQMGYSGEYSTSQIVNVVQYGNLWYFLTPVEVY